MLSSCCASSYVFLFTLSWKFTGACYLGRVAGGCVLSCPYTGKFECETCEPMPVVISQIMDEKNEGPKTTVFFSSLKKT